MLVQPKFPKLLFVSIAAVLAAALVVAGCGGGSGGGGGEPAGLMPKKAPVYLEANLQPDGKTSEALNGIAQTVLGIENIGEFVAEELEQAALGEGEKLNFEEDVEPWLGEKVGLYLAGYDGNEFSGVGMALETTDSGAAEGFIEERVAQNGGGDEAGEFEGHKYYEEPDGEAVLGMIGDYVAFGETKGDFEEMVKAFEGEGLNEAPQFKEAMEGASDEGVGNVYVDIGGLIKETRSALPPETEAFLDLVQIEPRQATAVATVIPRTDQIELDVSSNLGKTVPTQGDATAALEALPATAVLGFASADFGKAFGEGVEAFSENGVPGQLEPGELGAAFEAMGLDLKTLGESFGDLSGFVEGTSESNLGGALVVEAKDAETAKSMVARIGLLLRGTNTPGVTAINGNLSGFSVRVPELGSKPLIVGAAGEKIVVAYGPQAAAQALRSQAKTLGSTSGFEAAKGALGSTPMTTFVSGGPMLSLVETLLSPEELAELDEARPYLEKVDYIGVGSEAEGKTTTAKLVVGLTR
ncbi:MAG: DUF3352 domain-containing protein [Actinobacteria bacterium]|nr:DUF3352 domain-containing protein [Actinomycetota bacterium]